MDNVLSSNLNVNFVSGEGIELPLKGVNAKRFIEFISNSVTGGKNETSDTIDEKVDDISYKLKAFIGASVKSHTEK